MGVLSKYRSDVKGHFAIWFAVLALPLLAAISYVIDLHTLNETRMEVKSALDAASLAAVTNQTITDDQRRAYAIELFDRNFNGRGAFTVTVPDASPERVEVRAEGTIPAGISAALGARDPALTETSVSVVTREHVICMMTLNPTGAKSFSLTSGAVFDSPDCAVQVNSTHRLAAFVSPSAVARAKDFCVSGGASGLFQPHVNTECSQIADPYSNRLAPKSGDCISLSGLQTSGMEVEVGDRAVLIPGTYCDDIAISGKQILFMPGIYILNDIRLRIKDMSSARAEGVTFVLRGRDAAFRIEQGSDIYIKAPATGSMAGMAVFQDGPSALAKNGKLPTGTSELKGGSSMQIVGTVYMPTQTIEINGDSQYGNQAPATSYIGYDISLDGNSHVILKADHVSAGLPPILPRADEGARLIQ